MTTQGKQMGKCSKCSTVVAVGGFLHWDDRGAVVQGLRLLSHVDFIGLRGLQERPGAESGFESYACMASTGLDVALCGVPPS